MIEMLVVVMIVGLLATAAAVVFSQVQRKGRDGKRVKDLNQIYDALVAYKQVTGQFPAETNSCKINGNSFYDSSNCVIGRGSAEVATDEWPAKGIKKALVESEKLLNFLPKDPVNKTYDDKANFDRFNFQYLYEPSNYSNRNSPCLNTGTEDECVVFDLYARLEMPANRNGEICNEVEGKTYQDDNSLFTVNAQSGVPPPDAGFCLRYQ